MATVLPPPSKRQRLAAAIEQKEQVERDRIPDDLGSIRVQFVDQATGKTTGAPVSLPIAQANVKNLELLLNSLQGQGDGFIESKVPYRFAFLPDRNAGPGKDQILDISTDLYHSLLQPRLKSSEDLVTLQYTPQAVFKVRAVSRCSAAISGHGQSILATQFSPTASSHMVSGSGDGTARIWDCDTGTPYQTLQGHTNWVLAVSYSPDGGTIATGSMDNTVRLWNSRTGQPQGGPLKGHTKWITALAWEPYHLAAAGRPRLASSSKDATVRVWDAVSAHTEFALTSHKGTVSCVKWGGMGSIYTCSHDKTVRIWDGTTGSLTHTLTSHAHWVNHLALSTDFALRTAFHDHTGASGIPPTDDARRAKALQRFEAAARVGGRITERLVTASDDCTIYLWDTGAASVGTPVARLLGHQKQVNHVTFSPDGTTIASCAFDTHVKLWAARDGKFIATLRGHVAPVYQCCFSADSRLLVSASKDTTVKVWDVKTAKLVEDLPGHKDEVFAVDWSPDGKKVASGGKDKAVRIWSG